MARIPTHRLLATNLDEFPGLRYEVCDAQGHDSSLGTGTQIRHALTEALRFGEPVVQGARELPLDHGTARQ